MARPSLTRKRLLGIDRSDGPPPETQKGQPLRPWTIPNAISYVRLALLPVFLVVALSSGDGRDTLAVALYFNADLVENLKTHILAQILYTVHEIPRNPFLTQGIGDLNIKGNCKATLRSYGPTRNVLRADEHVFKQDIETSAGKLARFFYFADVIFCEGVYDS